MRKTNRLEYLGSAVGGDRGDAHLAHHLEHALAKTLDEVGNSLLRRDVDVTRTRQFLHRLHGQVRVDRSCSVADQEGDVVDLAHIASFNNERDLGASVVAQRVVMDGRKQ